MIMSPAAPLGQSKYAILMRARASASPGPQGTVGGSSTRSRRVGRGRYAPRWSPAATGHAHARRVVEPPPAAPCGPGEAWSTNFRDEVVDLARLVRGAVPV